MAIRRVEGKEEDINRALEYAKENGFINYFGMQRFGNTSISTHTIGRAILRGDWEVRRREIFREEEKRNENEKEEKRRKKGCEEKNCFFSFSF